VGPLYLLRVASLRAPLTDRFSAAAAGSTDARSRQKNMQQHFAFSGESNDSSADDALVKETAALYLDPRNRLVAHGPDSLTELRCAHAFTRPKGPPVSHEITPQFRIVNLLLQIRFLDHIIIGQAIGDSDPYFSFKQAGFL